MLGKAIDFNINGVSVEQLREVAMRLQRGGVGFYPGSFVHVDVGNVRHWPRMTHDQLARVFPSGRTVHVPSDGQPLPGYALALADIEKRGSSPNSMSLAAARSAGAISGDESRIASASKPKKGNVFARLFGFSTEEPDEDEDSAATPQSKLAAAEPREERPARVSAPQARPTINPKPTNGFALASASSVPVTLPPRSAAPRPPADVAETAERGETTSSITSWLNDTDFGRTDRVPPSMALAYAAQAAPDSQRPATPAPSMTTRAAPPATSQVARIPPKAGQRYNDPWMRGITLTSSVHYAMNVSVYGKLDVRQVRMMMIKPVASVPMAFGSDPYDGLQTARFSGAAVSFLPTVNYSRQQQLSMR